MGQRVPALAHAPPPAQPNVGPALGLLGWRRWRRASRAWPEGDAGKHMAVGTPGLGKALPTLPTPSLFLTQTFWGFLVHFSFKTDLSSGQRFPFPEQGQLPP